MKDGEKDERERVSENERKWKMCKGMERGWKGNE